MKAIRSMSKEERKAMNAEIRRQCVEMCSQFELDYDTMIVYVMHYKFGFGPKRIRKLLETIAKERKELKEYYCTEKYGDGTHFFAMREWLKKDGIDVEELQNEIL
jgi:hypothetical protein